MNDKLKIEYVFDTIVLSARGLHSLLKVEKDFEEWLEDLIDYDITPLSYIWAETRTKDGETISEDIKLPFDAVLKFCDDYKTWESAWVAQYLIKFIDMLSAIQEMGVEIGEDAVNAAISFITGNLIPFMSLRSGGTDLKEFSSNPRTSLYVLEFKDKVVKIGISANTHERLRAIQCASGREITRTWMSDPFAGACHLEKEMHKYFAKYRIKGEFFEGVSFEECVNKANELISNKEKERN